MPENKPCRPSGIVYQYALQGANDARWFLVEHQLAQVQLSIEAIRRALGEIMDRPENDREEYWADDCLVTVREMRTVFLGHYATLRSYLSDTDVPERISRKEL